MSAIHLSLVSDQALKGLQYQHINIRLTTESGVVTPADLVGLEMPEGFSWKRGIVLEGRAPIWVYGFLVHLCHPALWVACYDSRLGAVVVATHTQEVCTGQVLPVEF